MEQKGKRKAVDVNKEIREEYSDADIHKMAIDLVKTMKDKEVIKEEAKAANKAELEATTKAEAEKKTAELNEAAQKAAEEEALLSEEQKAQFDEFIRLGDADHKAKRYSEALVMYKAALNLKPNDKEANNKHLKVTNWLQREKEKAAAEGKQ